MSKRISNTSIVEVINLYFYKQGKKITNLQKANREKLDQIIKKYNINLDEMLVEVQIGNEKDKEAEIKRKEDYDRRTEEYLKEQERKEEMLMMKWNTLSLEDKEHVKNIHYNRYVEERLRDNEFATKITDKMEKDAREKGGYVRRVSENAVCIRGINVINGSVSKIKSREEWSEDCGVNDEWVAKYNHNQKLINELYEAEMISQGFEKGEDGDFYKTIIVRKRNKKNII
jgi:hypothetical protein